MIYIYSCYAGTHSSSIAAAIHLKKIPENKIPTRDEILRIEYFNKLERKDMGRIIFRGIDENEDKVYTVGRGASNILLPCIRDLIGILHKECGFNERIVLSNMSPCVTPSMATGGFLAKQLRMNALGLPFLILGSKTAFKNIVKVVHNTKEEALNSRENIIVLMNDFIRRGFV